MQTLFFFTTHTEVLGCFNIQERQLISDFPSPPISTRSDLNTNRDDWFLNLFLPEKKKVAKLIQCSYHLHHFCLIYHPVRLAPSSPLSGLEYLKMSTLYGGSLDFIPIMFSLNLLIQQVLKYRIGLLSPTFDYSMQLSKAKYTKGDIHLSTSLLMLGMSLAEFHLVFTSKRKFISSY